MKTFRDLTLSGYDFAIELSATDNSSCPTACHVPRNPQRGGLSVEIVWRECPWIEASRARSTRIFCFDGYNVTVHTHVSDLFQKNWFFGAFLLIIIPSCCENSISRPSFIQAFDWGYSGMSSQIVTRLVQALQGEKHSEGSIEVMYFSREARLKRGLKTGLICLAITALCVCIPGAHFVLVPTGLLLTPFMVAKTYRVTTSIVGAAVPCAACGGELTRLSSQERYPLYETCVKCGRENRIVSHT